jgi:hypothetical protein
MIKVSQITGNNVDALRKAMEADPRLTVTLTATTATFPGTAAEALKDLAAAREILAKEYGTRGHPVASLPAVRRKLEAQLPA